jgi:hypothetical protein
LIFYKSFLINFKNVPFNFLGFSSLRIFQILFPFFSFFSPFSPHLDGSSLEASLTHAKLQAKDAAVANSLWIVFTVKS